MTSIDDLALQILGKKVSKVNFSEIDEDIHKERVNRSSGMYSTTRKSPEGINILPEYELVKSALSLEEQELIFVSGEAGTGKSTFINWLVSEVNLCALVAPTAVAAINILGSTIHSLFGLPPKHIDPEYEYTISAKSRVVMENLSCLIIDEISMVSPNLLDAMSNILKRVRKSSDPFGGINVIMVGDLYQLPPIVKSEEESIYFNHRYKSKFFFSADVFKNITPFPIQLEKVMRQSDEKLIAALADVRTGNDCINAVEYFNVNCEIVEHDPSAECITLVPTNALARQINMNHLESIPAEKMTYTANVEGRIQADKWNMLVPDVLHLKAGAQVLMLNNTDDWINGDIGTVVGLENDMVRVRLARTDKVVRVKRYTWFKIEYQYNYELKKIEEIVVASFEQYPLTLGWAITIHKSQGMTFDKYVLDMGRGAFTDGQLYVALSRARSIESIKLVNPINIQDVKVNIDVKKFYERLASS